MNINVTEETKRGDKQLENNKTQKYFAAANSYGGFISYFDKVFPSGDFDAIYVLKGGPGTGKSSFMKKMSSALIVECSEIEEIYCSSDPHSLDGLIARRGERAVAIIDGTAPHERDAVVPGAIDSIINLGDSWDEKWLRAERHKILGLAREKSDAYKAAYYYLSLAGSCHSEIRRYEGMSYLDKKSVSRAKSLAESIAKSREGKIKTRLTSSFGRYGSFGLNTVRECAHTLYSINGSDTHRRMFMNSLKNELIRLGANMTVAPCPLDPTETDAIYLPEDGVGITYAGGSKIVDASDFADKSDPVDGERIKLAKSVHKQALDEAERWFAIASDMHFRLEEIYTRAMDFTGNDAIYEKTYQKIVNILASEG